MATTPQLALPNGSGFTTNLVFTTNQTSVVLTGTVTTNTAAIQISVNGGNFVSDPTLVNLTLQTFTIPNLASYPTGLLLDIGLNTIQVRSIDVLGAVSATATATITRVTTLSSTYQQIPTDIEVQRLRDSINILTAVPLSNVSDATLFTSTGSTIVTQPPLPAGTTFLGFNIYASIEPGGSSGYYQVNASPVLSPTTFVQTQLYTASNQTTWPNTLFENVRIRVTEQDNFGNELAVKLDTVYNEANLPLNLSFSSTLEGYRLTQYVQFNHIRAGGPGIINSDQWAAVASTDPLYYVVTGVFYDSITNSQVESAFSQEVLATPLVIDTAIRDLPGRTAAQITVDYVNNVIAVNTGISLVPGSTTRDVSIDPFASEAERIWFTIDFVHRSQSFLTLLQVDNVNGNGVSDAVATSAYKQSLKAAIGLTTDQSVQALIDQQFDKLATNVNKTRLPGNQAVGTVTLFTTSVPLVDIVIPANTYVTAPADSNNNLPSVRYIIGGSYTISAENPQAFYNYQTKRYEIVATVVCETAGSDGNRPAGSINQISGVNGISVINEDSMVFGTDQETNAQLSTRCMLAFASVDTGTQGGYESTAAAQIGIIKALVVKSGDALMMRDYDPVRQKHIGGKVDIWVQGTRERQVQDTFAFTFAVASNIQCTIIDLTNLIFEVQDSRVTPNTPIIELLDNPSQGLGVRDVTTGSDFDLTGATILSYNTFQLNAALADQPIVHIDDVIEADYRFQVVNDFFFSLQPVIRVVSVVGEVSGPLDPVHGYALYKTDDPLLNGESTISTDYLQIVQFNGVPSGNSITINNELHVMIGFFNEPLNSIGINTATIVVYSEDRSIIFNGPGTAAPDYDVIDGTPTTPVAIVRTANSQIASGLTVSIDYIHDENFTVTYVINDLLQELQGTVNNKRHVTADVIVKQAIQNQVNIETTVQLSVGATQQTVDPLIRNAVSLILDQKTIGEGVAQSNVDSAINDTKGVSFNVLPFALLGYADGSLKLRETVLSLFTEVSALNIGGNVAWISNNPLEHSTTDGGGLVTEHHGVFQDDQMLTNAASLALVSSAAGQGWIIGSGGAVINGYSDDATLTAQGFTTAATIAAQRLVLTANHVVVSISGAGNPPDNPTNHAYAVSYVVRGEIGSHDFEDVAQVEYIDLGNFVITYRNATG